MAASVGHKIVRKLDGTVLAQSYPTAKNQFAENQNKLWRKQAGGEFSFLPSAPPTDLAGLAPKQVTVTYPIANDEVLTDGRVAYPVTLQSLALTEYGTTIGHETAHLMHSNCIANYVDAAYDNDAELTTLATALARDWYRWRLGRLDKKFAGVVNWIPEGLHDHIEWTFLPGEVSTRVQRPEWNDLADRVHHYGEFGAFDDGPGGDIVVSNLYVTDIAYFDSVFVTFFNSNVTFTNTVVYIDIDSTIIIEGDVVWSPGVPVSVVSNVCPANYTAEAMADDTFEIDDDETPIAVVTLEVTLEKDAKVFIVGSFEWSFAGDETNLFHGILLVDFVQQPGVCVFGTKDYLNINAAQVWVVELTAGVHELVLAGIRMAGVSYCTLGPNTKIGVHAETVITVEKRLLTLPNGTGKTDPTCEDNPEDCCPEEEESDGPDPGTIGGCEECLDGVAAEDYVVDLGDDFQTCGYVCRPVSSVPFDFDVLNGLHTLALTNPEICIWSKCIVLPYCESEDSSDIRIGLIRVPGNRWRFEAVYSCNGTVTVAVYYSDEIENCLTPTTLYRFLPSIGQVYDSQIGACNWPETISLEPA